MSQRETSERNLPARRLIGHDDRIVETSRAPSLHSLSALLFTRVLSPGDGSLAGEPDLLEIRLGNEEAGHVQQPPCSGELVVSAS